MDNTRWKSALVDQTAKIEDAIRIIDTSGLRIALVVDKQGKLEGVVTDTDVRRGILKGVSLDSPVSTIMKSNPKTVKPDAKRELIAELMSLVNIQQIPIVDDKNRVTGLWLFEDIFSRKKKDNPVLIMAGGMGSRLSPLTDNCPKPMLKVGDKPMLETILINFIEAGFGDFYISVHYMADAIMDYFAGGEKWGCRIQYIHEKKPLGTGGALGLLPKDKLPGLPIIMTNGDVLSKIDLESLLIYHTQNNAVATICVREYEHQIPYGVIQKGERRVLNIIEKPTQKVLVNAGIYVLDPKIIHSVDKNIKIDIIDILQDKINDNQFVTLYPIHEYWADVGMPVEYEKAQQEYTD